ncbi:hypothetical protein J3R82DRAFT_6852 [Butyriboletus roseoflavus]|nr:hypothetical protein J3R82DRAFT_6852 [Butyriboletus roseoflavus]
MSGDRLIQATNKVIVCVHTLGFPTFAATITPFGVPYDKIQPYLDLLREQMRVQINDWVMRSVASDGVIDFAAIVVDPTNARQLNPEDSSHPNVAGYSIRLCSR